ncbi:hypothetical protein EP331_00355 [bacterium]|nr:MAG: hypothetical protein EP331_00355 [bacterium]
MASISRLPKNTFNFIRWYKATSATTSDLPITTLDNVSESEPYELTNKYIRDQSTFYPVLIRGQNHLIHFNFDERISDADFANWRIDLYDNSGNAVDTDLGTLTKCDISGSDYRMYATINISNSVSLGVYQMVILNTSTSAVKYQSNCINVIPPSQILNYTYLKYRNSTNTFNYDYEGVSGYINLFLPINVIDQQPEVEKKTYQERTTGIPRNQKNQSAKTLTLETYFFDEGAHDMMLALSNHDAIKINGIDVSVKEAYKVDRNKMSKQNKGTLTVYDQRYSTINLNG